VEDCHQKENRKQKRLPAEGEVKENATLGNVQNVTGQTAKKLTIVRILR